MTGYVLTVNDSCFSIIMYRKQLPHAVVRLSRSFLARAFQQAAVTMTSALL